MKCPQYIKTALERRARAAEQWNRNDLIVSEFIDKHNILVESYDYHGGCEAIVNPWTSNHRVLDAICKKENN